MSRISVHSSKARPGFTLVELMVALSVSAIVIAGVLAAYLFLGRNLGRMVNVQQQQVQSRRAVMTFTKDLSTASSLTTATATQIALVKPMSSGTATVSYTYTAPSPSTASNGTLARSETTIPVPPTLGSTQTLTILSNLTTFSFNYFNTAGTSVTSSPQSVKTVEFSYTSAVGNANSATLVSSTSVSPRVVLRNKPILQ